MKPKSFKSFDEIAAGNLEVSVTEYNEAAKCNDMPKTAVVTGLDAARAWLKENGGYSKLKANHQGATISGWIVYRQHSPVGHIVPTE